MILLEISSIPIWPLRGPVFLYQRKIPSPVAGYHGYPGGALEKSDSNLHVTILFRGAFSVVRWVSLIQLYRKGFPTYLGFHTQLCSLTACVTQ